MGEASSSEQDREDHLQVALSEYVNFPDQTEAGQSFEQVVDQAFDQASSSKPLKRRIWPSRSEDKTSVLGGVPGLRMMGF